MMTECIGQTEGGGGVGRTAGWGFYVARGIAGIIGKVCRSVSCTPFRFSNGQEIVPSGYLS